MVQVAIPVLTQTPTPVLPTGKAALPIKAGQAKAGEHYGSLKKKDVEEPLLDNVVAKPAGEDAKPVDAEGTRLTLESAVIQAPVAGNAAGNEAATEAAMPGQLAQGYPPSAQGAAGAALSEANNLGGQVFAYAGAGAGADALLLAQADTSIKSDVVASGPADPVVAAAGISPLGILGIVGLGLGALAAAGGSSAPTVASIDTTAPTVTNTSGAYTASTDTLVLTGTNYNTLLETGETAATDIKARLDWTKLSWDIDGDNATTDDVRFVVSDISSAKVTDGTHLTIVLASTKGTSLEVTSGYGASGTGGVTLDTLDITAGFARDAAGNAATTDAQTNAPLFTNAGQSVIDLGSYGKLIAPVQVEGAWYYYWDRSGDGTSADTGSLNDSIDYTTHDVLDGIFTQDINGGTGGGGNTTDTYRYATLNGVNVALPTHGGAFSGGNPEISLKAGTTVGASPASNGSTAANATYNDLLAIWDAYNGTGTVPNTDGTPTGWQADAYWSATPSASGHAIVYLDNGNVSNNNDLLDYGCVALQVL